MSLKIESILDRISRIVEEEKIKAYLVGGPVRDLIMGNKIVDIDICVEDSGMSFAKILNKNFKGKLKTYPQFNTASVFLPEIRIDVSTCREEVYPYPVSLPVVKKGDILTDLARRDFTINSIALCLGKERKFVDPFLGRDDIKKGIIKVLHKNSFIDDPTRIFRAIRFAKRFNFKIEDKTVELMNESIKLGMIQKLSKDRIRNEIFLLFKEKEKEKIFNELHKLGILKILNLKKPEKKILEKIEKNLLDLPKATLKRSTFNFQVSTNAVYLLSLVNLKDYNKGFFTRKENKIIEGVIKVLKEENSLKKARKPSSIYQILFGIPVESLIFVMSLKEELKGKIKKFLDRYSKVKLEITGKDLQNLGIEKGPIYKTLLNKVLFAKLDGKIKGKQEEIKFAEDVAKSYF